MKLSLIPLMGPFHLRYPLYNAVSVRDTLAAFEPNALALTPLEAESLDAPTWQDTPEVALPLAVVPWAQRRGLPVFGVFAPSPDPGAAQDFVRYLAVYPEQQRILGEVEAVRAPLQPLLQTPLTLKRIQGEVVPLLRDYQEAREERFEDGPGTDWLRARAETMSGRILALPFKRVAVLASVDHLPFLEETLRMHADLIPPPEVSPTDASRERSMLDLAFRGEVAEPGNAIAQLRTLQSAEARFHEANLLLAHGHLSEALEGLEVASRGDFSRPYFLPGYLLSRLGQLRDLAGERAGALRAYRGVLALEWAPREAREAALMGLERPFEGVEGVEG